MKRKEIRRYYELTKRMITVGERVERHYAVDDIVDLEERIKKHLDSKTLEMFTELENLHSEREAYSQEMGYVRGWKDAEKWAK